MSGKYWDASWNPIIGCEKCSPGCLNCWALAMLKRGSAQSTEYGTDCCDALSYMQRGWDGRSVLRKGVLDKPLHWKKPRTVATCWLGDMWRPEVPYEWIRRVYEVMRSSATGDYCRGHSYLVLTKRARNMASTIQRLIDDRLEDCYRVAPGSGLPGVWHGLSVCNQAEADAKIPHLLRIPGRRWLSIEPLLGPVDLSPWLPGDSLVTTPDGRQFDPSRVDSVISHLKSGPVPATGGRGVKQVLDWVVVGAETGPGARRCDPAWVQSIVDQCKATGVPVWVKQAPVTDLLTGIDYKWPREKPAGMP